MTAEGGYCERPGSSCLSRSFEQVLLYYDVRSAPYW